jgi:autotransporter-associated beta strand protein
MSHNFKPCPPVVVRLARTFLIIALLLAVGVLNTKAQNGVWTNAVTGGQWSSGANWLNGTVATGSGYTANFNQVDLTTDPTVIHLDSARTIGNLVFGDINLNTAAGWRLDNNGTSGNILTLAGTTPAITVNSLATGKAATIGAVIAGTSGLTKIGAGNLALGGATDTFTGGLKVNAGTLTLDFNASGSPTSTLVPSQVLTLAGGTLNINGNASTATSQSFSSTTISPGQSTINVAPASGANNPTLSLGALTVSYGATVRYFGPATIGSGGVSVPATAAIKTTTVGSSAASLGIFLGEGPAAANPTAAYATVGLYDWASTSLANGTAGTSPYTVIGGSQVAGFYSTAWAGNANVDVTVNNLAANNNSYIPSLRFNTPTATTLAGGSSLILVGGLLVTPDMGANNASISSGGATYQVARIQNPNGAQASVLWQNNTLGYFTMYPTISDGRDGTTDPNQIIKAGEGTLFFAAANTYSGQTYVNGGNLVITADSGLGAPANATVANLNGGTIVGNATFTLDNNGTNMRPITLLGNGGGLAATAGNTLTVDGQVGSAAGTGPLVIGIPASAANGNVAGLLPGSGSTANGQTYDTANPTPVFATGTVVLNNTNGNYFYGGAIITGGAILNISGMWSLGGGNYSGGLTFNNGTLQYNTALMPGTGGTYQDITVNSAATPVAQAVSFVGNAMIDVNGHNISYANPVGNGGSGALTVASTTGTGALTLQGANIYLGGTTVSNGLLSVVNATGSGTGTGGVNVTSGGTLEGTGIISGVVTNSNGGIIAPGALASGNGAMGLLTIGGLMMNPGSICNFAFNSTPANDHLVVSTPGGLTLNGGAVNLYQSGGTIAYITPGTYNLIQYTGAIGGAGLDSTWTTLSAGNPHVANAQAGLAYAFNTSGGWLTVTLSVAGVVASWTNDVNGNWSDATRWSSNPNVPHAPSDSATLGAGSTVRTVTLDANETVGGIFLTNGHSFVIADAGKTLTLDNQGGGAAISVGAGTANTIQTAVALNDNLQVSVVGGQSLAVSGVISNQPGVSKTLTVNGAGTTILYGANTYGPAAGSVGTTLSGGGTLQVGNNSALGAGDLSVAASSTLQAGINGLNVGNNVALGSGTTTTVDNNGNNLTLGGGITGNGALLKIGNGTLTLNGNNTYSGNTTINAGVLNITSPNSVANTPVIFLNGGGLLGSGTFAINNNIGIGWTTGGASTTALLDAAAGQVFTVNGSVASAGNTGVNALTVNSGAGHDGTLVLGGTNAFNGPTTLANGALQLASPLALPNSTLNYSSGALLFDGSITATTVGGLNGTNTTLGLTNLSGAPVALTVGNNNAGVLYAGNLSGSGSLIKVGTGTQTIGFGVSGGASYSGPTTINNGTLILGGVGNMTATGNLDISGISGASALNAVDSASVAISGMIEVLYDGGAANPLPCSLTVKNNASLSAASLSFGNGSRVASSSVTVQDRGTLSVSGTFDLDNNIGTTAQNNTVNLNGGTLAVGNFLDSDAGATHQAQINFNGGVLQANANDPSGSAFLPAFAGLTVYVNSGAGAVINPNGCNVTMAAPVVHGSGTPDGGLTLNGSGTLTLNGANTYTGNTTITNGTLALGSSGSINNSQRIVVGNGGVLDVSAKSGFTLVTGQALSNLTSPATLAGSLSTGTGTMALNYSPGTPAFTISNGTFTLNAGTIFQINNTGPALALGSYKLISTNSDGSGFIAGTMPTSIFLGGNGLVTNTYPSLLLTNGELYLAVATGTYTNPVTFPPPLAFPGAQGYGQNATGGRGGSVYHVTTLADSGPGSFRDAVSRGGRTIVFDVGGYIVLYSAVSASSGLTIAGQTAPGGGIGLMGNELSFYGKNNIICRHLRVRQGGSSTGSSAINIGAGSGDASNMIFDHTSVEFGQWDSFDAVHTADFTIQNCIIADPINQQFGAHVEGGNAFFFNNLWVNAHNRQPLAKANTVYINNVVYDYQAAYTVGNTAGHYSHDIVNNYFIIGPSSTSLTGDYFQVNGNQTIYGVGNMMDTSKDGVLNGSPSEPGSSIVAAAPWSPLTPTTPTVSAENAYRNNISSAGAFPSDPLDALIISQVTSLGTAGAIITNPSQTGLANSGYGTIEGGTALPDSDQDGMPDIWENATGSNPLVADNNVVAADGYTLLEHYLNWMAGPHAFVQTNATDLDLWPYTLGFTNGATYTIAHIAHGSVTLTNSHFAHFVPAPGYTGLASFDFAVSNPDGTSMTNTMGLLISISYIPKNLVWRGDGVNNTWDNTNTADWFDGNNLALFNTSDNVIFDDTGSASPAVNVNSSVAPGSVVFNASQNYTLGGTGGINGTGSLTKSGPGSLTVNTVNPFTGAVNLNSGTIQLNNGSSLGSGTLTIQSGTLINNYNAGNYLTLANPLVVPAGCTGNLNLGDSINLTGALTGGGTLNLTVQNGGATDQFKGIGSAFTGTVNLLGSGGMRLVANGGAFSGFNNALTTLNAPVTLGFYDNSGGNTYYFGALAGNNPAAAFYDYYAGAPTLQVGALNLNTTFAGQFQTSVNLVKTGTGTLTLTGNSTHTGTTTVSSGALQVNGSFSSSPVTVASGAALGGNGILGGGVTIQTGGIVSPGPGGGSTGTLIISNNLTLNSATLNFDLSGLPAGANDGILIQNSALTMSGLQTYNFNLVNHALGAGTYALIGGAAVSTANGVSFASNLPANTRQAFSLQTPASGVQLVVTGDAGSLVWRGTNGGNWDLATTVNWLNGAGADKFYNLDQVRFDDTATNGNVAIIGVVQPAAVRVTNNALDYTLGNGVLGGITSLTKSGAGMLTLNSSNSFTGGTLVNGGTLQLVSNYYAGGFGPITLDGGTLFLNGVGTGATLSSLGTNTLQTYGQPYAGFNLQGSGVLNLNLGGGGVFSPGGDWSGFSGTLNFTTGNGLREGASVFGSTNAVWNLGSAGGIYNKNGGATIYFGALFGGAGAGLSGATTAAASLTTYVIGGINTNSAFDGIISDGGAAATALVFNGPGSLTLTGNHSFSGGTTVNAGSLIINNTAGSGTGSGAVSINSGATLGGNGAIAGQVSLAAGATLAPGSNGSGTLTFNNDLGLNNASVLQFQLGANSDPVAVTGDLTLGGTLNLTNRAGFGAGTYPLFTYGGALSVGTLVIGTAPAGYGYTMDTSVQGQVNLIVSRPQFGNLRATPDGLVMSGSGGPANASYYLLMATNLATPLNAWTRMATNQFDAGGNFNFTNPRDPGVPRQFYQLQLP